MIPMHTAQSQVPFVDLAAQYAAIAEEIDAAVSKTIREADFILGRAVRLFEEEFARFCEAQFATGVDSGTSALELNGHHAAHESDHSCAPLRAAGRHGSHHGIGRAAPISRH